MKEIYKIDTIDGEVPFKDMPSVHKISPIITFTSINDDKKTYNKESTNIRQQKYGETII